MLGIYPLIWLMVAIHPFHVSVCEIQHNPKTNTWEIAQKVFLDDLERALRQAYNKPQLDVTHPKNPSAFDSLLEAYYRQHVHITCNQHVLKLQYLGHERKEGNLWSYLESSPCPQAKVLYVENSILMDAFTDQQNFIHVLKKAHGKKNKQILILHPKQRGNSVLLE